jgi:hypothetical protein
VHFSHVRIIGTIPRSESAIPCDAALELGRHFFDRWFFERVSTTAAEKGGAHEKENDR